MNGKIMLIKKYLFHGILLSILIVYLLSANFLFDQLIPVKGESHITITNLPDDSKDIRYNIDNIYNTKLEWKEMITITGWAFIKNQNTENCSIFLVFSNNNTVFIFDTHPVTRRDVTKYFKKTSAYTPNLDYSGFEANIAKGYIDTDSYRLGILIENQTAQTYILTNNYCTDGNCSIIVARIGS